MSPLVALARAKRRIMLPFAAGLDAIIVAALLWLDARKSPCAWSMTARAMARRHAAPADQDPACNKACAAAERRDATASRDRRSTGTRMQIRRPLRDGVRLPPRQVLPAADAKASSNAHHGQATVVKSSAYPQDSCRTATRQGNRRRDSRRTRHQQAGAPYSAAAGSSRPPRIPASIRFSSGRDHSRLPRRRSTPRRRRCRRSRASLQGGAGGNHWALTGTAEPNTTVAIFDGGTQLAAVTASASGSWSYITIRSVTKSSAHTFTAKYFIRLFRNLPCSFSAFDTRPRGRSTLLLSLLQRATPRVASDG